MKANECEGNVSINKKNCILGSVVGHQETIEKLLMMVKSQRMPNSLLFVGPSYQGKKLVALGLAQALVCEAAKTSEATANAASEAVGLAFPCGVCPACVRIGKRQSESLILVEPEKGQIKIESARSVVQKLSLSTLGRARVVIVDEVQQLSLQAANALLKVIEEPPQQTYFILITSNQESVLKTLRSRSQMVRFKGLSRAELLQLNRVSYDVELRAKALKLWLMILSEENSAAVDYAREHIESREQGTEIANIWFEFLRDQWFLFRDLPNLLHEDLRAELIAIRSSDIQISVLSEQVRSVERDLAGNCDLQLTFENFIHQARAVYAL